VFILGVCLFVFHLSSDLVAAQTPLSHCPQNIYARRYAGVIDSDHSLEVVQLLTKFYTFQTDEANRIVLELQADIAAEKEAVNAPYITTEGRAEIAKRIAELTRLLKLAQNFRIRDEEMREDLEILMGPSVGDILALLVPFTSVSVAEETGVEIATGEQARSLMTMAIRKEFPSKKIHYIPADREPIPHPTLHPKVFVLLRELGGREPDPGLVDRIWKMPLIRDSLYNSNWGRMEIYWELAQRNTKFDLIDPADQRKISLIVDKIEDFLLRPAPETASTKPERQK
jgi:type III secretion system FlhB-like substrate exporter